MAMTTPRDGRITLVEETPVRWRIEPTGQMHVPGIVFASRSLLPDVASDRSLMQVVNVATLPGIVGASYAMPDVHWGYGFPIGGVAATDVERGGVVSPGGVGFDISCGVRLLTSGLHEDDVRDRDARADGRARSPRPHRTRQGRRVAPTRRSRADRRCCEADRVTRWSAATASSATSSTARITACARRGGRAQSANEPSLRGIGQVGSLGSGNHFLEVQVVDHIYRRSSRHRVRAPAGRVCVMIHCGSRGLGHQICSDHVRIMQAAMPGYGIAVPDPPARVRAGHVERGSQLPRGDGRGGELRAGQPPAAHGRHPTRVRGRARRRRPRSPLRRLPQPRQARAPRRSTANVGCCACTARAPPAPCRPAIPSSPTALRAVRSARAHPGFDGHRLARAGRGRRAAMRSIRRATAPVAP